MGKDIPVTFTYKGIEYEGVLSNPAGGGSASSFHLTVNKMYWGQLIYYAGHAGFKAFAGWVPAVEGRWHFYSNSDPELSELAEWFGFVVTSYCQ